MLKYASIDYYVSVFIYDKNDKSFDDLCVITTKLNEDLVFICKHDEFYIQDLKAPKKTDTNINRLISGLNQRWLSNWGASVDPQKHGGGKLKDQITCKTMYKAMGIAFGEYLWDKSASISDITKENIGDVYDRLTQTYRDPDKKDLVDLSYLNSDTNINDLYFGDAPDRYPNNSLRTDSGTEYSKITIILVEKDKDVRFNAGLLKLDKGLYEKIDRDKMSPREFMISLASMTNGDLWSNKFMYEKRIYV